MRWRLKTRTLDLTHHALTMGILNVTPDSFSDGGNFFDLDAAVTHALDMLDQKADLIDVGGESTRPGAEEVSPAEEIARTIPAIEAIRRQRPDAIISIDTSKAAVAEAALEAGAEIINDVTGLRHDPKMIPLAARTRAGVVIMHMQGTPRTMQENPAYEDVTAEVRAFFENRLAEAAKAGIQPEAIVFDPGIGFGKSVGHNLELIRNLDTLTTQARPILLGVSRKSFIAKILDSDDIDDRAWPTVALSAYARDKGRHTVRILRVHDVAPNAEAIRMTEAILGQPCHTIDSHTPPPVIN